MPVCNFCFKLFSSWEQVKKHEETCLKNYTTKREIKTIEVKEEIEPQIKVSEKKEIETVEEIKTEALTISIKDIKKELLKKTNKEIKEFAFLRNISLSGETKKDMVEEIIKTIGAE
jgi:hypothetical protein